MSSWRRQERQTHLIAALAKRARGHEAVAAVVAGPQSTTTLLPRGKRRTTSSVDAAAGIFHQSQTRNAALDGELLGAAHFFRCKEFEQGNAYLITGDNM